MINDRRQLADVYQQTIDIVQEGNYTSLNGEEVKLLDNEPMLKGSRFYTKALDATSVPTIEGETKIIVENDDSIHCGHQLQQEGYNPVVLNLASRRNPGGGIYVPKATVFRAGAKHDFALLDNPYYMSFVAVPAINHPLQDENGNMGKRDAEITKNKMRTILRIGLLHGHDSIVLGAFGCGAFRNPPRSIARLFHEVIDETEFKNKYKLIAFAILEDHNSPKGGNLQPFIDEFK
ncbi:TIGR02452 family protein [Prevotella copri]|uniref:TIGR02452 family protein n=1 Tax=Segatella copri TaxID=165179 RepID=A0AAP3B9E6_9BACT|nr:TIGR02452 family protein [Segatella copri]MCW4126853.1 TIGR02452 family protein [Segatella copri]MCW4413818.1 TIGR02452 family protein [Segatella copri]MCW4420846.1 TIGR02452 family protein [Segatella copri]